ncbi:hypothetical protein VC83_08663 [Pseudogymnoascus destructans]|uniref:Uncharacterized protein n=2 Tax=Pseudogymnoascus destructans TaxID=655981 RepID=L8FM92_PSED2|nr:uncharacterized protein VC83_08663 [Pseudogymnoascus destructans]ELR02042.1 hypothetical protein GMDG_05204 [Pseudogymnoascus destructans 20631-21]OAF54900.1 hypothetical protein VC83_08663 [Pseudogymnoascus destructans]
MMSDSANTTVPPTTTQSTSSAAAATPDSGERAHPLQPPQLPLTPNPQPPSPAHTPPKHAEDARGRSSAPPPLSTGSFAAPSSKAHPSDGTGLPPPQFRGSRSASPVRKKGGPGQCSALAGFAAGASQDQLSAAATAAADPAATISSADPAAAASSVVSPAPGGERPQFQIWRRSWRRRRGRGRSWRRG